MVSTNAACKVFVLLACVVLFQITEPGNVEPSKIFCGYPIPTKILDHESMDHEIFLRENLKHENYITRKFPDLRYVCQSASLGMVSFTRLSPH